MLLPDSDSKDAAPDGDSDIAPVIAPDVMARILEPRVRSNAKNNAKIAKNVVPKIAPKPEISSSIEAVPLSVAATEAAASAQNAAISASLSDLREMVATLQQSHDARDRAFDLLYEELNGYKNDFYLERLKPSLRALLFLLDSIEEFEREIEGYRQNGQSPSHEIVRANLIHFRDQLSEVLTLCDLSPVEPNGDKFDPKTQRAIEVVKVDSQQNNTVQRQIRGGWKLGEKLLRPADVVVGKSE